MSPPERLQAGLGGRMAVIVTVQSDLKNISHLQKPDLIYTEPDMTLPHVLHIFILMS